MADRTEAVRALQDTVEHLERENRKLREIEEAAREVSFHDGNDTACLCPVHGGLCSRCEAFKSLRTALEADTGGRDRE